MPSTILWLGTADLVARVATGSIDSVDATPADNTFTVTIGGVSISVAGDTDVNTTAAALRAALSASTHPYFAAITWSGSTGNIVGTAKYAGVPFVAALTKSGTGSGTVTDFAETTANSGPSDLSVAANYSGGALPTNGDTLIIENCKAPILWNLEALAAVTLAKLWVRKTMTGLIGLRGYEFLVRLGTGNAEIFDDTKQDYRPAYLKVGATSCIVEGNSQRIKLDQGTAQTAWTISEGLGVSAEPGVPAIRLLGTHASNTLESLGGHAGVAMSATTEASTAFAGTFGGGMVDYGPGVTYTKVKARGGGVRLRSIGSSAEVEAYAGGQVYIDVLSGTSGDFTAYVGGTITATGEFAAGSVTAIGGTIYWLAGTVTTPKAMNGGVIDSSDAHHNITFTSPAIENNGRILVNPLVTFTNALGTSSSSAVEISQRII